MNNRNAWGFLSFGLVMGLIPLLSPERFPPTGIDGTSARALWLEFMGVVQLALGGARVLWHGVVPAFVRWLAFTPPPVAPVIAFETERSAPRVAVVFPIERQAEAA